MPKPSLHILRWSEESQLYELTIDEYLEQSFDADGGPAWSDFLGGHTSFAFQGRAGHLSVIKEMRQRGTGYWYAYRSHGQRAVKRYLGLSDAVTMTRLEEIASALARAIHDTPAARKRREMTSSLLQPKLQPPRLSSSLITRPRLLRLLDSALKQKITLLVAPAGFGKTTLVHQWINYRQARHQPKPVAWISFDSADNDPFRFWRYIIAACQTFQKDIGQTAFAALSDALQPPFAPS